ALCLGLVGLADGVEDERERQDEEQGQEGNDDHRDGAAPTSARGAVWPHGTQPPNRRVNSKPSATPGSAARGQISLMIVPCRACRGSAFLSQIRILICRPRMLIRLGTGLTTGVKNPIDVGVENGLSQSMSAGGEPGGMLGACVPVSKSAKGGTP